MRRPLGVSVHVSPLLNFACGNLQKLDVTEDDMILVSYQICTRPKSLLILDPSDLSHSWDAPLASTR